MFAWDSLHPLRVVALLQPPRCFPDEADRTRRMQSNCTGMELGNSLIAYVGESVESLKVWLTELTADGEYGGPFVGASLQKLKCVSPYPLPQSFK